MPKDQAYQLADKKIAKALKTGATELDLQPSLIENKGGKYGEK